MSEVAAAKFSCPSCGRQFSWKPELAGRSAKCKCGATIKVPPTASAAPAAPRARAAAAPAADEGNPLDAYDFSQAEATAAPAKGGGGRTQGAAPAADAGLRCPSCSGAMLPGAVICVSCGFNLKTGKRMSTVMGVDTGDAPPAAAPAGRGVPGVPGYAGPPGLRPARVEEGTNAATIIKMVLIPLLLIGVVGGAVFGYKRLAGEKDTGPNLGRDKEVRAMIRDDSKTELKKWLADKKERLVTGMTREQADGLADRLYKMGAVEVFAFGGVMTASLGVELPADKEKRKVLFDWYRNKYEEQMSAAEQTRDVGQKYLLIYPGL
jgi:hypothetical protein